MRNAVIVSLGLFSFCHIFIWLEYESAPFLCVAAATVWLASYELFFGRSWRTLRRVTYIWLFGVGSVMISAIVFRHLAKRVIALRNDSDSDIRHIALFIGENTIANDVFVNGDYVNINYYTLHGQVGFAITGCQCSSGRDFLTPVSIEIDNASRVLMRLEKAGIVRCYIGRRLIKVCKPDFVGNNCSEECP